MTSFFFAAALMLLAGLMFFLPALTGKRRKNLLNDRAGLNLALHRQRQQELALEAANPEVLASLTAESERNLLGDLEVAGNAVAQSSTSGQIALAASLVILPIAALTAYFALGRPDLLDKPPAASMPDTRVAIDRLTQRLSKNPNDLEGWVLLGRSLQTTQQPQQAAQAYEFAMKLAPDSLDLKAHYAETLAEANQGSMAGKPAEIVQDILANNPNHTRGLWLAGIAAAEHQDMAGARQYWEKLKSQFPEDSQEARDLTAYMARLGEPPATANPQTTEAGQAATTASIRVKVTLSEPLAGRSTPDDAVFIFARAAEGPPMPLAVVKKQVKDLPLEVVLDDSMAMRPGMTLSAFERVVVGARVSKSGQPMPSPGDLQGLSAPVKPGQDTQQSVTIDQVVEAK